MIDYQNITGNEIKRIVAGAANPKYQVQILSDLTGKSVEDIERAAGLKKADDSVYVGSAKRKYGASEAEKRYIKEHADDPVKETAAALGRSTTFVQTVRRELGVRSKKRNEWDESSAKHLATLWAQGLPGWKIAHRLERSLGSVMGKLTQLKEKGVITEDEKGERKVLGG